MPIADDFIYPVGNPRIMPSYDSTAPNGYRITQMFNNSCDPSLGQGYYFDGQYFCGHTGVDLSDLSAGGEVHATAAGMVVYAGYNSSYGEMVRIKHLLPDGSTVYSQYEHMIYGSLLVGYGQIVAMGQTIGYVGSTGFVTGPHLHFEIKSVDEDGVGYTFGNAALLTGYVEPISFVAQHSALQLPTPTPTLVTATPTPTPALTATTPTSSTQVLGLQATATGSSPGASGPTGGESGPGDGRAGSTNSAMASNGGEQHAVLADFYRRYSYYVVVTAEHLNVRAGSGFSFAPLNSVQKGARLGYLGLTGNGWVHVALPSDVSGYVARQWVKGKVLPRLPAIEESGRLKPPFAVVLDTLYPARSGPKMHDPAIEVLKKGEKLTYLGTLGSWDKVILPSGRIGWVLNWYLREPAVHVDLSPSSAPARPAVRLTCPCVVTTVDGLNLRRGPRLAAPVIESLPRGTRLAMHGYHTSWVAVTAPDGQQGYVMAIYVQRAAAATAPATATAMSVSAPTAAPTAAPASDSPDVPATATPAPTDTSIAAATAVTTDTADTMAATATAAAGPDQTATAGSTPAITPGDDGATVTATPQATESQPVPAPGYAAPFVYVNVDHANVRAAPSMKAEVFVSEPDDTKLALLGTVGPWSHVETRTGVTGWVMSNLLRAA